MANFHKENEMKEAIEVPEIAKQVIYKKLVRIDHCTWIDLNKVIGAEINYKKSGSREYFEVIIGYTAIETVYGEEFNSSLIGVIPWINFDTFDEAKQYLSDIGIELVTNENFKFNKSSWKYRNKSVKYQLELEKKND